MASEILKIEIFPWNVNFECGIAQIDTQHRRLVDLLNTLVEQLAYNSKAAELERVFEELRNYAMTHFADEEIIWRENLGCDPWEGHHRGSHQKFIDKISELQAELSDRAYHQMIKEIVSFLTHWLATHILESDKMMAKAVLAVQSGVPLNEAKVTALHDMSGATRVLIDTVMGMYDSLALRTIQLTQEIAKRRKSELISEKIQKQLLDMRDFALRREAALRTEYEHLLNSHETQNQKMRAAMESTIMALSSTLESRDPYTGGHQHKVGEFAVAIARELGLEEFRIEGIKLGAIVHDIGKIQVPLQILCKPTRLTDIEMRLIRQHPETGWKILKDLDLPWPIATMVRQHHEYLDGTGYPLGISADQIILEARILTVADIVESMSSARPYRSALGIPAALEEISSLRGTKLDPDVVDACLRRFQQ